MPHLVIRKLAHANQAAPDIKVQSKISKPNKPKSKPCKSMSVYTGQVSTSDPYEPERAHVGMKKAHTHAVGQVAGC